MAPTIETFRFVSARRAERVVMASIASRLVRDRRDAPYLLGALFGPGPFEDKLETADVFASSPDFLAREDPAVQLLDAVARHLRAELAPGVPFADLRSSFAEEFPAFAALLRQAPPADVLQQALRAQGRLWDSLYAQTTRGCDRYVSTNHLVDGLRVYHVLLLLWLLAVVERETWTGGRFDEYHPVIDLQRAAEIGVGWRGGAESPSARSASLGAALGSFRVPLTRGSIRPPAVGDLLLVEQDLRRYEMGELADLETVMRGERRERTTRLLSRTTQTTAVETTYEQEEGSSLTTDERFQLSSEAQTTASQGFGLDVGVNVSAKYGPVQVAASVNASYDTSESTSQTSSQEYARSVTEEATRRVRNSVKESSSVTVLTESQDTTLRGFNNEGGAEHVNGLYRWLDKVYEARLLNYGRRLMLSLNPPEPALHYRHRLAEQEDALLDQLDEPLHPSRLSRGTLTPLPEDNLTGGFLSHQHVTEDNYAQLAAFYDVTGVGPPPAYNMTGSKAVVVPEAMQATEMKDDGLSLVVAESTLTVDPDYRITRIGVHVAAGPTGGFHQLADNLRMGEKKDETDRILVQVGRMEWHFTVTGQGNAPKKIRSTFNETRTTAPGLDFGDRVQGAVPVTVSARFSGMLVFTVVYSATVRDDALDRWRAATYAAVLKGYAAKRQAWEQASAATRVQARTATVEQTHRLREDQYRAIELTELKRGCIELLTEGTALGPGPVVVAADGTPSTVHDEADAAGLPSWRSPLASGAVVELFELAFDWSQATYQFHPYYWAGQERWAETANATGADPVFEQFLRSGSASVNVPVRPGYERPVVLFLKTGLVWGGGYLPLFTDPDMLDVYADVELGVQMDPPVQVGEPWELRLPTSLVMLQADDVLPEFPAPLPDQPSDEPDGEEPLVPEDAPF